MTYLKKYGLRILYTFLTIIILLTIITGLYYFNLINNNTYKIFKIIIVIISILINSFILGKISLNKGYLEGIKLGLMIITIFFILTLVSSNSLNLSILLYYFILLITSIFGSMFGISRKKDIK